MLARVQLWFCLLYLGITLWVSHTVHLQPRGIGNWNVNTNNFILNSEKFQCLSAKTIGALYSGMLCHVVW